MRGFHVFVALALLPACYTDEEAIGPVAWSDDDAEQAYFHLYYEESTFNGPYGIGHKTRNHRHQVFAQLPDGTGRRPLTGLQEGLHGAAFYYMRSAGYLLMDVPDDQGVTRWDLLRLSDGSTSTVARFEYSGIANPCQSIEVLPSPDGSTIGVFERVPPAGPGCNGGTFEIDLVDAATLSTRASFSMPMDGMPGVIWTREGDLMVWNFQGGSWRIDPVSGPVTAPEPTCSWPRTSSSDLSADGVRINTGTVANPVDVIETGADNCWI